MSVELVVARYCEDLAWLSRVPSTWRVSIYDKSAGGPRARVDMGHWKSADGPDAADVWPGAIELPNVGCEAQTYFHHIVERYDSLAPLTLFAQGSWEDHLPSFIEDAQLAVDHQQRTDPESLCATVFGPRTMCDADGRGPGPTHIADVATMARVFRPDGRRPNWIVWHPPGLFLASAQVLRQIPREQWAAARETCTTKWHAMAMERLWHWVLVDRCAA